MRLFLGIIFAAALTACSGGGSSDSGSATINTTNRAPVAVMDSASTMADTSKLIDVLTNDSDPDGDSLTLMSVGQPSQGAVQIDSGISAATDDDMVIYTPNPGFVGQDQVSYTISDGHSGRASGSIMITVLSPPDPPAVAKADAATTLPNTPITIPVLSNDLSDGISPLAIASVTAPINGTIIIRDNGTTDTQDDYLEYTPTPGFVGIDSFVYQLGTGQRAVANVEVTLDPSVSSAEMITGTVTKDRVRGALVRFYRINSDGIRIGSAIAQSVTDGNGQFWALLPTPRTNLLAVSFGGAFIDETDSRPDAANRRVIEFGPLEGMQSIVPTDAFYIAVNAFTDSLVRRSTRTALAGQFLSRYFQLRDEFTSALGFDPVSTAPSRPDAPNPTDPVISRQYAMALGGVATALNKIGVRFSQPAMSYPIISGVIDDLSRCLLDGENESGPVHVLINSVPVALPTNIDLNLEILRFRNNKIAEYISTPLVQIDLTGCGDDPLPPPPPSNNASPTAITIDSATIDEVSPPATLVGTFLSTDIDPGDIHSYSLVPGPGDSGNSEFVISGDQLLSNVIFDFETQSSYSIRVRSDDGISVPFEQVFSIAIADINETPTAISIDPSSLAENLAIGTLIGTLSNDDDAGDSHSYTLVPGIGDSGNAAFTIVDDEIFSNAVYNFESQAIYSIRVRASDGISTPLEEIHTITVNDINEAPTANSLDTTAIDENLPGGTVIGTFTTTDEDAADSHTYTLIGGAGDTGNGSFNIVGDQLVSNAVFNFEALSSYSIRVRTDDTVTAPFDRNFTITVNDINEAPTANSLDITTIDENLASGTVIGTFTTTDEDPADSHTYTLIGGAGDTGNGSFNIVGDQLVSNAVFDFEAQSSYSIRVRTDDTVTAPFDRTFTITVNDVNEAPTANSLDTTAIDENLASSTVIGTFTTTDEDPADSHTYTLIGGAGDTGNGSFNIVGDQLVSNAVFDFEAQSSYSIRVRTDDGVTTPFERTFSITVNDINDAPTANSLDATAIDENLAAGTVIGTFTTTDQDPADSHTYTLVAGGGDTGNGSFNIVGDQLRSNAVFDFEIQSSYSIRVRTDDGVTTPFERTFSITVNDINDAPTANSLDATAIDENLAAGTVIGTFTTTDQDPADSHTYTLVAGGGDTGNGSFNIVGDQLRSNAVFDFEIQSSYSIRVRTDDGVTTPFERSFAITVNDINDAPEPGDDTTLAAVDGPITIDVLANDIDQDGDTLTIISVASPTPAGGLAAINDNATPADSTDDYIDYSPPAGYEGNDTFSYTVSDGTVSVAANIGVDVSDFGYVDSTNPASGQRLVPVTQTIEIVFSQAMNAASLDGTSLVLSRSASGAPAVPAVVSYNAGTLTATIDPTADLEKAIVYFIWISGTIENSSGQPQGFDVVSSFTVTLDPNDSDSDGLDDILEGIIGCVDPMIADSDSDGVGDGIEYYAGGDPCSDQGQSVYLVDDDGATTEWPAATTGLGGYSSGTAGNPNYVLLAEGSYPDQIDYAAGCDYLIFAGSQVPTLPGSIVKNSDGSPTTVIDMGNSRKSEFDNCTEVVLRNIHMTRGVGNGGQKGGGLRVSNGTTATLESVWLTNNSTGDQGGGLGVSNASIATVNNSVIKDNSVTGGKGGGGVWVGANATLLMTNTLVIDNEALADGGGGLYFDPMSTGMISNTYLVGNTTTGNGAGLFVLNDDAGKNTLVDIDDSVISGNSANVDGGGVYISGVGAGASAFNVRHNRISDNQSTSGAGIMLRDTGTETSILNNLILGNSASTGGGAIHIDNSTSDLRNNTIIYNRTTQATGAAIAATGGGNPLIRDSIIWQNRAGSRLLSTAVTANDNYSATIVQSDFNLLEVDKIGGSDLDFVNDGVTPGFDSGFYLDQLSSPAVETGSDTAAFLGLDLLFTAAGGPTDAGTVDRGFHHPTMANYPADGYIETGGLADNEITVSDSATGLNAVAVIIRPLASGIAMGTGHHLVATLEGINSGLAQLTDSANVDPLSDGESVLLSDLGNGDYRAFVEAEAAAGGATTIPLRIYVDGQILPVVFNIDRIP